MIISSTVIMWVLFGAASFSALMIGINVGAGRREAAIQDTIDFLIENNYLKSRPLQDGDIELIKYDE